jgi:hypothetical protein
MSERDDLWEDLAQNRLSDEERALLRVLSEDDATLSAKLNAFSPLGADFENRVVERVARERSARRRRLLFRVALSAPLAAAAVIALALLIPREGSERDTLTTYELTISAGAQETRARTQAQARPRFEPGTRVDITLTPAARVEGAVEAAAFLARGDELRPLDAPIERASSGALRMRGRASALFANAPIGQWTLIVIVGSELPNDPSLRAALATGRVREADVRVLAAELEIAPLEGAP